MKFKKICRVTAILLSLSLISASLLGCEKKNEDTESDTETVTSVEPESETTDDAYEESSDESFVDPQDTSGFVQVDEVKFQSGFQAYTTDATVTPSDDEVAGEYCILVNEETGEILAQKNAYERISPASMTKILTILVAVEHCDNLDADVVVPEEATAFSYLNDCSSAYLLDGDVFTFRDLLYMTILPSGGDAAMTLAIYTAGSMEAFVDLMNEKVEELGLSETSHFTNPVGVYDEELYTTAYDMSMILKAAEENEVCRQVLGKHVFQHSKTQNHPEGLVYSNLFLRRIEDHIETGTVMGAKTGFVNQAGSCAASYEISNSGTPYIAVVAKSYSSWGCIFDHVALYDTYAK